jgi:hypothetical protein
MLQCKSIMLRIFIVIGLKVYKYILNDIVLLKVKLKSNHTFNGVLITKKHATFLL